MREVLIIGGGIGGLTLALCLHRDGIPCLVLEAAPELRALGVGINILPHAAAELARLGLDEELARVARPHRRGELLQPLRPARPQRAARPRRRLRPPAILHPPRRPARDPAPRGAGTAGRGSHPARPPPPRRRAGRGGRHPPLRRRRERRAPRRRMRGAVAVGCDGIHSVLRRQLHPGEGEPKYTGYNMWRGVSPWPPILTGATMARIGWLATGKMVLYPIRNAIDAEGRQLLNWVFEIESDPTAAAATGTCPGDVADVLPHIADWRFPWLDVPAMLRASRAGAGIPDGGPGPAATLDLRPPDAARRRRAPDGAARLQRRRPVHPRRPLPGRRAGADARTTPPRRSPPTRRSGCRPRAGGADQPPNPPDAILRVVYERTGDKPFARIEDVISARGDAGHHRRLQARRRL